MPRLSIDDRSVEVPAGGTILDAARALGVDVPTLCFLEGLEPGTSCMICLVKDRDSGRLLPACATPAQEGMQIESETAEIHALRRSCLELILSDHVGDCTAPCQNTCPVDMDIPRMLSQVEAGELRAAIETIKTDIAIPAVLGRVCPELCERTCRRSDLDGPASICLVKRHVADVDLASPAPYVPPCEPANGRSVAIVGAGPTGLSAAFHLQQAGHTCTLFDSAPEVGGMLLVQFDEEELPRSVLRGEVAIIERMGARFRLGEHVDVYELADLRSRFDAVLIATGQLAEDATELWGLPVTGGRLHADPKTHTTLAPGVFAAGDVVIPSKLVVRCVAAGKSAAHSIGEFLHGREPAAPPRAFTVRVGRVSEDELVQLRAGASDAARCSPISGDGLGLTGDEAVTASQRCLHCECTQRPICKLRLYAERYGARANHNGRRRKPLVRQRQEGGVVFEPGKCILCGLCVQIASQAREPLGLTFIGRGFDIRVGVPFDRSMAEGMSRVARRCADACPTGAISIAAAALAMDQSGQGR